MPALAEQPELDFDPSKVLPNPNHEQFAKLRAGGLSQSESYKTAFGVSTDDVARANASRLVLTNATVRQRISHLSAGFQPVLPTETLSLTEKRRHLASYVRADLGGDTRELLKIAQKAKFDRETGKLVELSTPDRLRALELDAKLAGELSGEQPGVTMINIDLRRQLLGRDAEPALEVESVIVPATPS